jgi:RNA polymerase sigma factor (sigma-70 family)
MADPCEAAGREVSEWIGQLAEGGPAALIRFFHLRPQFVALSAHLIRHHGVDTALCEPEDAVQDTWLRLCQDVRDAKLGRLASLDDLRKLFGAVLRRRVEDHHRRHAAIKRGGAGAASARRGGEPEAAEGPQPPQRLHQVAVEDLDQLISPMAAPEAVVLGREQAEWLLNLLEKPVLRAIARRRMDGETNQEIAGGLGLTPRTVERKLAAIRAILAARIADESP